MSTLTLNAWGRNHTITLHTNHYAENGNLYVGLICWDEGWPEPWSDLTVNLSTPCRENCAFIDTNNNGWEIIAWLIENKLGKLTGRERASGWCSYPEFEFDMDEINKYMEEELKCSEN